MQKETEINELIGALHGLVSNTDLHENDCECNNIHEQSHTKCRYCYAKEILEKYTSAKA